MLLLRLTRTMASRLFLRNAILRCPWMRCWLASLRASDLRSPENLDRCQIPFQRRRHLAPVDAEHVDPAGCPVERHIDSQPHHWRSSNKRRRIQHSLELPCPTNPRSDVQWVAMVGCVSKSPGVTLWPAGASLPEYWPSPAHPGCDNRYNPVVRFGLTYE